VTYELKKTLIDKEKIRQSQYVRTVCQAVGTYDSSQRVMAARMSWAPENVIDAVTLATHRHEVSYKLPTLVMVMTHV
jgi:hypothetical protein